MAKNLRQKYKEAKQKLSAMNWRLLYPPVSVNHGDIKIRNIRASKVIDIYEMENMKDAVMFDLAFDIAKCLVENNMIKVTETVDPFSGKDYVFASVDVVEKDA